MPDQTLFFLFESEIEAVVFFVVGEILIVHRMHQIEIEVAGTGSFQLFVEDPFLVFFTFDLPFRQLGGNREAFARIAVDDRLLDFDFRHAMVVDVGSIKISQTGLHIKIDHPADLFVVDDAVDFR